MNPKVEDCINHLKEHHVRITPQRHAILTYLIETHNHPTADDIYQALVSDFPSMSVATVYNNLRLLMDMNIVTELKYGDTSSRFDLSGKDIIMLFVQYAEKLRIFIILDSMMSS